MIKETIKPANIPPVTLNKSFVNNKPNVDKVANVTNQDAAV